MCYTITLKMSLYPPQKTFLEELEKISQECILYFNNFTMEIKISCSALKRPWAEYYLLFLRKSFA